jgi:tripartite-type tricarboxylate transporter receptor subunit TctC
MNRLVVSAAAVCAGCWLSGWTAPAPAQAFPSKTVRIILPYPVGGSADVAGRIISPYLSARWKHQVYLDPRPGGNTVIGTDLAAKSPPDGHTLLITSSALSVAAAMYPKLPFDALEDLVPIVPVTITPQTLVAHPSLPARTIKELVALAKSRPGQLNIGDAGPSARIAAELFAMMAGVKLHNISYKGAGPMMTELMGGHITLGLGAVSSVQAAVRSGRVRLLGVGSLAPSATFPGAPVIANDVPGFEAVIWFGLLAPRGTPREIVERVHADVAEILAMPEVRQKMLDAGAEPGGERPQQFGARIKGEIARFGKVVKAAGLKPE